MRFSQLLDDLLSPAPSFDLAPPTGCEYYAEKEGGLCKVTSLVCPHFQSTFRKCPIRELATTLRSQDPAVRVTVSGGGGL